LQSLQVSSWCFWSREVCGSGRFSSLFEVRERRGLLEGEAEVEGGLLSGIIVLFWKQMHLQ